MLKKTPENPLDSMEIKDVGKVEGQRRLNFKDENELS